jgi:predicted branched-subunit amino acid permease
MADDAAYASPGAARTGGARDAFGLPALGLAAGFVGFGAIAREAGWDVWLSVFSTVIIWATPAQVLMAELYATGTSLALIVLGVAIVNMRFLPMSAALAPTLLEGDPPRWRLYIAMGYLAILSWAFSMRRCPRLPPDQRLAYMEGFYLTVLVFGAPATWAGFVLAGVMPGWVTLGLVALPAMFFILVFIDGARLRIDRAALLAGAAIGPPAYLLTPQWSLMVTGLVAGTAAYWAEAAMTRREKETRPS